MKVKRYLTSDLPEAVQMIRRELGSDAIILNTKEVKIGGFLGMFRKRRVEVIAAVDEASRQSAARSAAPRPILASPPIQAPASRQEPLPPPEPDAAEPVVSVPSQAVRHLYNRNAKPAEAPGSATPASAVAQAPAATPAPAPAAVSVAEPAAVAVGMAAASAAETASASASANTAAAASPAGQAPEDAASLMQELRAMKDMMQKMARQQSFRSMPESVLKWSRKLAEQGVEHAHVEQFAEEVRARLSAGDQPDDAAAYEAAKDVLRGWLVQSAGGGIGSDTRIVHFVGPTGVGKTTTIAKLAADQSFTHRRTVGFITADTYRISAVDQLRTYADILNVPLEVVFSPSELTRSYKKLADRDLLFMDTAGRNYRNELYVSEVNSLLAPGEKSETFLVLSLTHKYADLKALVVQFAKYGINRLLLTKADETDTYGSLLNLVRDFSCTISYITNGQTVPDDIRVFDPEEWVCRLLGESAYE